MPRDRRGQILLVAALVLAVTFVALALVLNTVVFTENLATRNHDRTDDALGFAAAVEDGAGGLLAEVNRHNDTDYGALENSFRSVVAVWDANASFHSASGGTVTATAVVGVENGTRVSDDAMSNFTVDGVSARRFELVAEPASTTTPLTVVVSDGSDVWRMDVVGNGSSGADVTLTTAAGSRTYADLAVPLEVDLTEGELNGRRVNNWTFAEGVTGDYDVELTNSSAATGRYQLFVDEALGGVSLSNADADHAIYSADVNVTVRRSTFTYGTTLTVAPEDAPWNGSFAG